MTATLLVACEGDAPVACGGIPDQTLHVRQASELQPCFEDQEGEELVLSAISSDPEIATVLVYGSGIVIRGESVGSATITVTAWDPGGLTGSMDIGVVVPNRNPVYGFYDWVELKAAEANDDAGPEWHAGPPDSDLLEAKTGPGFEVPRFEIRRR